LEFALEFKTPFTMQAHDAFDVVAAPEGTRVVWTNSGDVAGLQKVMGLFIDSIVGPDYEAGLHNLKTTLEQAPSAT
jgi:hypothetical protein